MPFFVPHTPLMRKFAQEGNGVGNLLGVTTSHEGEIVMHQGRPGMYVLRITPNKTR